MSDRIHTNPIAAVYARALLESVAPAERDAMADLLQTFVTSLEQAPDLRVFLETPALDIATKQRVLESLRGKVNDRLLDFLGVLIGKQRTGELDQIAVAYRELADRTAGRVRATLRSAVPLDADLQGTVRAGLQARLGREVVLGTRVDPQLIAGLVVEAEDTVWEASARGWLNRLAQQMVRSSGNED